MMKKDLMTLVAIAVVIDCDWRDLRPENCYVNIKLRVR